MDKPISVQVEEAKLNIVSTINAQNMHVSILDLIVAEIYSEIHAMAQQQYQKDKEEYENSQQKEDKK